MDSIADYGIFEVCFNEEHTHIEEVHAYTITEDNKVNTKGFITNKRDIVVIGIELFGKKYITLVEGDKGLEKGADVMVVEIEGEKFIKTKKNNIKKDNLDNLPEY